MTAATIKPKPKFAEGDKVRNVRVEMGTGVVTRHGNGPRSVRWVTEGDTCWWVSFPDYRDSAWVNPSARGRASWFCEDALEPMT